jgi:hypothetical protein
MPSLKPEWSICPQETPDNLYLIIPWEWQRKILFGKKSGVMLRDRCELCSKSRFTLEGWECVSYYEHVNEDGVITRHSACRFLAFETTKKKWHPKSQFSKGQQLGDVVDAD